VEGRDFFNIIRKGGVAERGLEKVERGRRWGWRKLSVVTDGATGKRSAVLNFYPYKTRISSHNLPLATVCIKYAKHIHAPIRIYRGS